MRDVLPPSEWFRVNEFIHRLFREARPPVVSLYVPPGKAAQAAKRLEHPPRDLPPGLPWAAVSAAFREELARRQSAANTVCLFGWPEGPGPDASVAVRALEVSHPLPRARVAGDAPYAEPLKDVLEVSYSFLLVLTDHQRAVLRSYFGADVRGEKRVRSYVERHHKKGGASAGRFQRAQREQAHQHLRKVQEAMERLGKEAEAVLIGGPGRAKHELLGLLGQAAASRTRLVEGLDLDPPEPRLRRRLVEALDGFRKDVEQRQLERAAEGVKSGLLVKSNEEVDAALRTGAVETLLVASDYHVATPEEEAQILRMLEAAERTGVEVEFVTRAEPLAYLHRHGSVVARLRYPWKPS